MINVIFFSILSSRLIFLKPILASSSQVMQLTSLQSIQCVSNHFDFLFCKNIFKDFNRSLLTELSPPKA